MQRGGSTPVFAGAAYQRGYGVGRVMRNMLKEATPLLKQAGKQAVKTGLSVVASGILGKRRRRGRPIGAGGDAAAAPPARRQRPVARLAPAVRAHAARVAPARRVGPARVSPVRWAGPTRPATRSQTGSGKVRRRKRKVARDIFSHK